MTITKPAKTHTFVPTTVAKASEVNTNFDNVFGVYDTTGYLFDGWFALAGASLEYNSATSFKTTTDVDLTSDIQVGDKITFEQSSTEKFAIVTAINYNSTVANRTYIQVMGDSVANSAITAGTVGFSRAVRPSKFPIVDFGGARNQGLINGKIVPSVASNNLTVAIQTLAGTTPSATNPVGIWIGDTLRWITGALSISANAGTNWFNSGSAELATKEIDYFAYIGYNATDGITLGFARIPYARLYSDFNTTTTNERYARISTITNAAAGDNYVNIGRFAATLSASASFNWSVPSYTNVNLIQEPIYYTRKLSYVPVLTSTMGVAITQYQEREYIIRDNTVEMFYRLEFTTSGVATNMITSTIPISASNVFNIGNLVCNRLFDGGNATGTIADTGGLTNFNIVKTTNWAIGTLKYIMVSGKYTIS